MNGKLPIKFESKVISARKGVKAAASKGRTELAIAARR
jgi:hypothetical protein